MSFLSGIWKWFKGFFVKVGKTAIGIAAESISDYATHVVKEVDKRSDMTGKEKFNYAKDKLHDKYPSIEDAAIDLAIQAALALVRDKVQ